MSADRTFVSANDEWNVCPVNLVFHIESRSAWGALIMRGSVQIIRISLVRVGGADMLEVARPKHMFDIWQVGILL